MSSCRSARCLTDRLYAATWQRHRTVAAYVGGGPESGIHMSEDGGDTWTELTNGLARQAIWAKSDWQSPRERPDVLYAAIELNRRTGGVWRSENRGAIVGENVRCGRRQAPARTIITENFTQVRTNSIQSISRQQHTQVSDDGGETWRGINNEFTSMLMITRSRSALTIPTTFSWVPMAVSMKAMTTRSPGDSSITCP